MANTKAVGQFYVDTTRETMKGAVSAQDAGRRYLDEVVGVSRAYCGEWAVAQKSTLQTAFQLQNSVIEASLGVLNAMTQANRAIFDEWAKAVADGQGVIAKMSAAGTTLIEDAIPSRRA